MASRFCSILSYLFHPLFIPGYLMLLLPLLDPLYWMIVPVKMWLLISAIVWISAIIFPLLLVFLMIRMKWLSSAMMEGREDRIFPLVIMTIFYFLTYYLIRELYLPKGFLLFILGSVVLVITTLIITLFYRISLHTIALGGASGLFFALSWIAGGDYLLCLIVTILLSGFIGWARLDLQAHKPAEIYTGWVLGFLVIGGAFVFF